MEEKKHYTLDEESIATPMANEPMPHYPQTVEEALAEGAPKPLPDGQKPRHSKTWEACVRYKGTFWTTDPKYAWPR